MTRHRAWLALAAILLLSFTTSASAQSARSAGKKTRALVLSGGGPVCEAWQAGLIVGMAEKGVDLSTVDLIVGTSAGSIVGAQLALSRSASSMPAFEGARAASMPPPPPPGAKSPAPTLDENYLGKKLGELAADKRPAEQVRAEIGAWALSAHAVMSEDAFVSIYTQLFPRKGWTQIPFECVAVDAHDGSTKIFSKDSGVDLARAVASSCAVPGIFPPVTIDGHRYMDGGMRSLTNADLAKGYGVVIVVDFNDPSRRSDIGKSFGALADRELKILRDSGSTVESIAPDAATLAAFGPNRQDPTRRKAAFAAGLEQGRIEAQKLKSIWKN
ncbi:MAG TPA: patatin-like phospholipase family protein [Candidatus Dormibacteraeota bacterium]|nr:patatin-like phospholipase family protein [Candidatus Dormibacteraeota bacterium]